MLRMVRAEQGAQDSIWSIESPTPGVVLIDVAIGGDPPAVPLHWRAGTWRKPPLDLALDAQGQLLSLQFALQDEHVAPGVSSVLPELEASVPTFDVANWPEDRYLDEKVPVVATRLVGGELSLKIGKGEHVVDRAPELDSGLVLAFPSDDRLAEIRLGPLAPEDWRVIDAFSFVE